jgi:hypothetical protein
MFSLGKGIVKSLTKGNGDRSAIFSFNTDGLNVLHFAAMAGNLVVCKYLVEELGGDGNAPGYGSLALGRSLSLSSSFKLVVAMSMFPSLRPEIVFMMCIFSTGSSPFMMSAQSCDIPTFKYFLDRGGDLMKADDKGRTALHHAAGSGDSPNTHTHSRLIAVIGSIVVQVIIYSTMLSLFNLCVLYYEIWNHLIHHRKLQDNRVHPFQRSAS